jgi:small conductance mechanosensitive channel
MASTFITQAVNSVEVLFKGIYLNFIVAVIILLLGFICGRILSRLTYKILKEVELKSILNRAGIRVKLEKRISSFVAYFVYFISIIMALNQLKIATTLLQMIVGAVLIIVIVSLILGIKDFIPNIFAGLSIYKDNVIEIGEYIETQGVEGKVTQITLSKTKLETKKGDIVFIPNSVIIKKGVIKKKTDKKSK